MEAMVDGATEAAMGAGVVAMVGVMPTSGNGGTWGYGKIINQSAG